MAFHSAQARVLSVLFLFAPINTGLFACEADFASELDSFRRLAITGRETVEIVSRISEQLCDDFPDAATKAEVLYTLSLIHARSGHKFPTKSHGAITSALECPQPRERQLLLTVYLGDSASLLPDSAILRRRNAATACRDGIRLCINLGDAPLTALLGQPDMTVQKFREIFERQLAWTYHDHDSDLNELRELLKEFDIAVVDRVVAAAEASKPKRFAIEESPSPVSKAVSWKIRLSANLLLIAVTAIVLLMRAKGKV